jgi:hypothetical protein
MCRYIDITDRGLRHLPLSSRIANQSLIDFCAFWLVAAVVKAIHTAPATEESIVTVN